MLSNPIGTINVVYKCLYEQFSYAAAISYSLMRTDLNSAALNRKRNRQFASSNAPGSVRFTQQIIRYPIKRTKATVQHAMLCPLCTGLHKTMTFVNKVLKK